MVTLEHRFYGQSQPLPNQDPDTLKQFMKVNQALADAVAFIQSVQVTYPNYTCVGVFGGSYPYVRSVFSRVANRHVTRVGSGALAAWARVAHPDVFDFAIASSAPVLAVPDFFAYLEVADRSLSSVFGEQCDTAVRSGFDQIAQFVDQNDMQSLHDALKACDMPTTNTQDLGFLTQQLASAFMGTIQYNAEIAGGCVRVRACEMTYTDCARSGDLTIQSLCNIMVDTSQVMPSHSISLRSRCLSPLTGSVGTTESCQRLRGQVQQLVRAVAVQWLHEFVYGRERHQVRVRACAYVCVCRGLCACM
jgi:hypothetical protein